MSEVYVAFHERLGGQVALKVPRSVAAYGAAMARVWDLQLDTNARRIGTTIGLDGFVGIRNVGVDPERRLSWVLMDFVQGKTLAELLRAGRRAYPVLDAIQIVRTLAVSLGSLHRLGTLHGDVKPSNIMLREGTWRGAELLLLDLAPTPHWRSALYLAPEGFGNPNPQPAEDVYALGLVFYELLTGRHPFAHHQQPPEIWNAHKREEPPPVEEIAKAVPPALAAIVAKMIAKDPSVRYATCRDVVKALDRCVGGLVELPTLDDIFDVAPATERAPTAIPEREPPRLWMKQDGIDNDDLAVLTERARAAEDQSAQLRGFMRVVIVEGPRRLLGFQFVLRPGEATFGRAIERDILLPHCTVAMTHGAFIVTADGGVRVRGDPVYAVEVDDVIVLDAPVPPFSKVLIGAVCLQLFPPGAPLPTFPEVTPDLFAEEERLITLRAGHFPLIQDLAATSPAPSKRMSLANARQEEDARGKYGHDELLVRVLRRNVTTIAEALSDANGFEARAKLRAGEDPAQVIRRHYGEDVDWLERARALIAATPPD